MAEGGYPYNSYQWPGYPNAQPGYAVGYGHGGMVQAAYGAVQGYHQPGASPWPPQHQQYQQHYVQQAHAAYYQQQQQQQQAMMSQHMQQQQYARQYPQSQYAPQQGVSYQQRPVPPPVPPPRPPPPPAGRRSSSQGGSQAGVGTTPAPPEHASGGQQNQGGGNSAGASQQRQQRGEPARQPHAPPIDTTAAAAAAAGQTGTSSAASTPGANSGSVLLAALQNNNNTSHREHAAAAASSAAAEPGGRSSSYSSAAAAQQGAGSGRAAGPSSGGGNAGASSSSSSAQPAGRVDLKGVYLQGVPTDVTKEQLQELFSGQYGRVANVQIIGVKGHVTKCAFVNFASEASAQKLLAVKVTNVNNTTVHVLPKIVKTKTAAGEASSSNQAAGQQGASSSAAGTSKQAPQQQQQQQQQQSKSLGVNEDGLPMVRGAVCCPFYMGMAQCSFKSACKYHHPRHAMHPECLLQGKKPQRYDYIVPPSYARLVNFTERLWDYDSCAEAQLKIWLARHLLASECSGCGMFDESAAVPAADEDAAYPDESQPLGPYSCTMDEADQVLQLLWKAQPDEAAKQAFPYKGKLWLLLADDPYYEIAPDPFSPGRMWVKLLLSPIKGLLNY